METRRPFVITDKKDEIRPLWLSDIHKSEYQKSLSKLKDLSEQDAVIHNLLIQLLDSKSPEHFKQFESIVNALLTAKADDIIRIPYQLEFKVPAYWGPRIDGYFSTGGSVLYETLVDTQKSISSKNEDHKYIQRILADAEINIQNAVKSLEEKKDFANTLTIMIDDLEKISAYLLRASLGSPLYIINEWFGHECARLFFKRHGSFEDNEYPYVFIEALNHLPILKIKDKNFVDNWSEINSALDELQLEEAVILKAILDEYWYQQALCFYRKSFLPKDKDLTEDLIDNPVILKKLLDHLTKKQIPYLPKIGHVQSISEESLQELLKNRIKISKDSYLPAYQTFATYYEALYSNSSHDKGQYETKKINIQIIPDEIRLSSRIIESFYDTYNASNESHFINYFLGWPQNRIQAALYFLGGFVLIPLLNTLKFIVDFIPKVIEVAFNHAGDSARKNNRTDLSAVLYATGYLFKGIWALGRLLTSPMRSIKACISKEKSLHDKRPCIEVDSIESPVIGKKSNSSTTKYRQIMRLSPSSDTQSEEEFKLLLEDGFSSLSIQRTESNTYSAKQRRYN